MSAPRVLVTGWPRTGKSTTIAPALAAERGCAVRATDDLIGAMDWSAASAEVATWLDAPGPYVIEGVAGARALRKWLEAHPGERPPVDLVVVCRDPLVALTGRQAGMGKGVDTVLEQIMPELLAHGIRVETQTVRE